MMETILVTGGAGFIGSHLVERLLSQGRRVYCLDNFDPFYAPEIKWRNLDGVKGSRAFHLIDGDIRDPRRLDRLFKETRFDAIVHLAARPGVRPSMSHPSSYIDVNIGGTTALLDAACRREIRNFVFTSASSVYGASSSVPFSEEDAADHPISPYAVTKRSGELICRTYHHLYDLPVTCLRLFSTYGPRQRPDQGIYTFARLLMAGEPIPMFGDGTSTRDYLFVADAVDGILLALDRPHPYEIINLGTGRPTPLREMIETLGEVFDIPPRVMHLPEEPTDVAAARANIRKANCLLGYEPRVELREGLRRFRESLEALDRRQVSALRR